MLGQFPDNCPVYGTSLTRLQRKRVKGDLLFFFRRHNHSAGSTGPSKPLRDAVAHQGVILPNAAGESQQIHPTHRRNHRARMADRPIDKVVNRKARLRRFGFVQSAHISHTAQAQQAQAAAMQQDPLVQMQQQELQLKGQEGQRKAQKDATDAQLKQSQQQIERERIATQKEIDMARIQATVQKDQQNLAQDAQAEKNKLLAEIMRNKQ